MGATLRGTESARAAAAAARCKDCHDKQRGGVKSACEMPQLCALECPSVWLEPIA